MFKHIYNALKNTSIIIRFKPKQRNISPRKGRQISSIKFPLIFRVVLFLQNIETRYDEYRKKLRDEGMRYAEKMRIKKRKGEFEENVIDV